MIADAFYGEIVDIFTLSPRERHAAMVQLHARVRHDYVAAVQNITEHRAGQPLSLEADNRTLAEVVAHITAWERFGIMAAADLLIGLDHLRSVTDVHGYMDQDGRVIDFADVHEFNAYQRQRYATYTWPQIQQEAIDHANILYTLFAQPQLLTAERLERTKPHHKRLRNGALLDQTTMGWCLWVIYLDHEAVEHADALGLLSA
jgi:hypothetical protein